MVARKKAVVKRETSNDVAPSYMKEGTRGSENVTANDLIIPRVGLIQALSPQRKKTNAEYIEGAEEGAMFNSVTSELYGETLEFIPVYFKVEHVIWKDREKGGGFRGAFDSVESAMAAKNDLEDGDDCEIKETAQHYVLIPKDDGAMEEAILSMSSSKLSTSRKLNSLARIAGGDRFSRKYALSSVEVDGAKGEYYSYTVKMVDGFVDEDEYKAGETMYDNISSGKRTIDREGDVD